MCYRIMDSKTPCNYGRHRRIESSSKSRNANRKDVQSDFICDAIIVRSRLWAGNNVIDSLLFAAITLILRYNTTADSLLLSTESAIIYL